MALGNISTKKPSCKRRKYLGMELELLDGRDTSVVEGGRVDLGVWNWEGWFYW